MARKPTPRTPKAKRNGPKQRGGGAAPRSGGGAMPTREEVMEFVRTSQGKVGKREIARAFGIKGPQRLDLNRLLAEMSDEGELSSGRKHLRPKGGLPAVTVIEIVGRDDDGDLIAKPAVWEDEGERPAILLVAAHARGPEIDVEASIGVGDRVLSRISEIREPEEGGYRFEAHPIKKLPREKRRLVGVYRASRKGGGNIEPIDRKQLRSWSIAPGDEGPAKDGDLVRFDLGRKGRMHVPQARILETLGNPNDQRQISLIAVHTHGIPDDFPEGVISESKALQEATLAGRTDLRDIPLITIDPPDARDHDDAVYAEPDSDPANPGGFIVYVAIADVSYFVRPGSRLDREAQLRGNSVYFPDRVVPMLPERISNDLCSLREGENRACLAVRMVFDKDGAKRSHTFMRGLMRSAAKLSYQEAQAAIDGNPSDKAGPLLEGILRPLWDAHAVLAAARDKRGPLDLDLPERKIVLDKTGHVADVVTPERLTAHRLIEEFMIQANVAAAEMLEQKKTPVVYRIHDQPSKEKLASLRDFLDTIGMKLPQASSLRASHFNGILKHAKEMPVADLVNEVVLRSQSQAEYNIENVGHFGLNLRRYAHFTSPIRRYADLLVHRALVKAIKLGEGGLDDSQVPRLREIAQQISEAERRAMAAERETIDRLIAAHLADRIGAKFAGRIAGVTRSGLFVRLTETGADGFVPVSSLGTDFFNHVEAEHALVGKRSGETYRLGDNVEVRLVEAIPSAGALRFEMLTEGKRGRVAAPYAGPQLKMRRGKPRRR
ncbi:3'-to-5' exoribonuclease RNase R [Hyphomicrobium sulfonivorans]|uniref:Ribonuclease R n=1 Tax=Hyphomicrobium sulfonivorans TaxID=121290 RepID=A0A109BKK6_HYPSL|nr:3'-to-5' exoribonuclease RNase R [Hyphomicrobium sulfonivorans]